MNMKCADCPNRVAANVSLAGCTCSRPRSDWRCCKALIHELVCCCWLTRSLAGLLLIRYRRTPQHPCRRRTRHFTHCFMSFGCCCLHAITLRRHLCPTFCWRRVIWRCAGTTSWGTACLGQSRRLCPRSAAWSCQVFFLAVEFTQAKPDHFAARSCSLRAGVRPTPCLPLRLLHESVTVAILARARSIWREAGVGTWRSS